MIIYYYFFFFFQAEDGIRDKLVTGVQTCALPISYNRNFPGRNDGMNETMSFLTSPEIVTAVAFAGDLTFDPVHGALKTAAGKELKFEPPQGEELPAKGFARVEEGYVPPAQNGESLQEEIPPGSA